MQAKRLELLATDLWGFVFCQLDAEPDWTGDDVGRVAGIVSRAFEAAIRAIDSEPQIGPATFREFCSAAPECVVCGRGQQ
jgi:hypothetical protein